MRKRKTERERRRKRLEEDEGRGRDEGGVRQGGKETATPLVKG